MVKTTIFITINIITIIIMFPETKGKSWSNLRQAAPPIPPKMPPQLRNCSWRAPPWKMLYFSQRWIGNKSLSKIAIGQRSSILAEFQILIDITQTCGCSLKKGLTKCFCPLAFNCKNMFGKFCHVTKCTFFPPKCSMSALSRSNPNWAPTKLFTSSKPNKTFYCVKSLTNKF